jgi:hypothetical protein
MFRSTPIFLILLCCISLSAAGGRPISLATPSFQEMSSPELPLPDINVIAGYAQNSAVYLRHVLSYIAWYRHKIQMLIEMHYSGLDMLSPPFSGFVYEDEVQAQKRQQRQSKFLTCSESLIACDKWINDLSANPQLSQLFGLIDPDISDSEFFEISQRIALAIAQGLNHYKFLRETYIEFLQDDQRLTAAETSRCN